MTESEFIFRAHVENGDTSFTQSSPQLFARNRLQVIPVVEIAAHDTIDLGDVSFRNSPKPGEQIKYRIVGKAVVDELAVTPSCDEASATQVLEMLRGVGDG